MRHFFPVNIDIKNQKCLVVGGGCIAERKVLSLIECEADVVVVSPKITSALTKLAQEGKIKYIKRGFNESDLKDSFIVICATNNQLLNEEIGKKCKSRRLLVNVVDYPPLCNFLVPAVIHQGNLCVSISTSGASPTLARKIKDDLKKSFGPEYSIFLEIMEQIRYEIISKYKDKEAQKEVFESIVYSDALNLIREGKSDLVKENIKQYLL